MLPMQAQVIRIIEPAQKNVILGTSESVRRQQQDVYHLNMFHPNHTAKKDILQSLSEDSKLQLRKSDELSLLRKRLVYKALESNQRFLWGETIVFDRFYYSKQVSSSISGLSTLLKPSDDDKGFQLYKDRQIHVTLNYDKQSSKPFYPADFFVLFSKHTSMESKKNSQLAFQYGYAGMNCCQFVYYCLEQFYPQYQDIFAIIGNKAIIDKNALYEPLGFQKSKLFGYKTITDSITKEMLSYPLDQRKHFVYPKDIYDPFQPNNPSPGDLIFFIDRVKHKQNDNASGGKIMVKHVCIYVGMDRDGDLLVTGSFKYPLKNGTTVSTAKLNDLLEEMKAARPKANRFTVTTVPLPNVIQTLNNYVEDNRSILDKLQKEVFLENEEFKKIKNQFHIL